MTTIECDICDHNITHNEEYFQSCLFQFKKDSSNISKSIFYYVHKKCWTIMIKQSSNFTLLVRAYSLVNQYKESIEEEMYTMTSQGTLWTNGRCHDWHNYNTALQEFTNLEALLLLKKDNK